MSIRAPTALVPSAATCNPPPPLNLYDIEAEGVREPAGARPRADTPFAGTLDIPMMFKSFVDGPEVHGQS